MSFVERIKVTDGTEVASVNASNQLEVAEANSNAIKTAVELIDNAISGSEMQVDVVAPLPAGTNNIGDVDVLTVPAPLNLTGGGVESSALRVTLANDSTGVLSIDDNGSTLSVDDGGGSLTVDGTVAATQSGTWNVTNVSGTVSLPTGAATSANQSTEITSLQLLDDVVAVDGSAALTKLYQVGGTDGTNAQILSTNASGHLNIADGGNSITVDGTVAISGTVPVSDAGGSLTVDGTVTANLAAGTNNIGDVDVLTVPAPLNVTGSGLEASALRVTIATDSTGVLSVDDNGSTLSIDDGGSSITVDGTVGVSGTVTVADGGGSLTVDGTIAATQSGTWNITNVSGTISLPTGAATSANQSTVITSLQLLDDVIVADNTAFTDGTTKLSMAGYVFDEVAGTALTENDAAAARIDSKRAQIGIIEDGTTRGRYALVTAANALKVDGSAVTQPVSISGSIPVTDNSGSLTVDAPVGTPVFVRLSDGASAISTLPVSLASVPSHAVTNAGTFAVQADQSGTWSVRGQDGSGNSLTSAARGSERALSVQIVDGSGNQVTSFSGGGTQYAEDAVSSGGESLTLAGTIRQDTPSSTTSTDGDYANLKTDSVGRLWVNASGAAVPVTDNGTTLSIDDNGGSITVDGTVGVSGTVTVADGGGSLTVDGTVAATQSGTWNVTNISGTVSLPTGAATAANQSTEITSLQLLDDVIVTDNAAFTDGTTKLSMVGFIFDEVAGTALTENDAAAARIDSKRAQIGIVEDGTTRGRYATVTAANALKVDGSAVTQPVSGTFWQATQPVSNAGTFAVQAAQSGTWSVRAQDGSGNSLTSATRGSERALSVQIVDGSGNQVTSFGGGGTQYNEDVASAGGELLTLAGAIRQDTPSGTTSLDGDYTNLKTDSVGRLWVNASGAAVPVTDNGSTLSIDDGAGSITVDGTVAATQSGTWNITDVSGTVSLPTGAATSANQSTAITALQLLDDVVATDGSAALTKLYQVGGTDGTNAQILSTNASGHLNIADGGNSITVDGTFWQATQPVSIAASVAVTDNSGSLTVDDGGTTLSVDDGGGSLTVDGTVSITANSSVNVAQFGGTNVVNGGTAGTQSVGGIQAHDAAISGNNPVLVGGYANSTTGPSLVADGDLSRFWCNGQGAMVIAAQYISEPSVLVSDGVNPLRIDADGLLLTNAKLSASTTYVGKVRLTDGTTDAEVVPLTGYNAQAVAIVDGSGSQITSFGGGTQYTEGDTDATITGTAMMFETNTGTSALGVVSASNPLPVSDNGTTLSIDDGAGSITVDGTVAATQSGTWNVGTLTSITNPVAVTDNSSSLTVDAPVGTPVFVRLSDGASAISTLPVSLASVPSHAVTNAGTFAVQVDGSALTALQLIDDTVFVDDAAFTIATSKVNAVGGYAVSHGSNPDAADAGDAGIMLMNRHRIPFIIGGHPNLQSAEYYTTAAQTNDNVLPLISAGTKYVITGITVIANAANTVNVSVRIGFGASAVPTQGTSGADAVTKVVLSHPNIPPGSGFSKGHAGGIVGIGGDGDDLYITCSVPTTGSLIVQVDYYTIES